MKLFKRNRIIFLLLILSIVGIILGYLFIHSYDTGLCYKNLETRTVDTSCHQSLLEIGDQLFYPSIALAIVFLILLFIPQAVRAWRKFAVWYIPFAFVWMQYMDQPTYGWDIGPSLSQVALYLSGVYVVSAVVGALGSFYSKKSGGKTPWYLSPTVVAILLLVAISVHSIARIIIAAYSY